MRKREPKTYGYCRISRKTQDINRQIRNIQSYDNNAQIIEETFTATQVLGRKKFEELVKNVKPGDTIIFDSVSRMSRNAEDGTKLYFDFVDKGVNLIFLKEHYIDTDVYIENLKDKIELQNTDEDEIFKGLNNYFRKLAKKQIRIAFEQAEKEVKDLQQRTREGIETARLNGKQIGQVQGAKLHVKKKEPIKEKIRKHAKDFGGSLTDIETMQLVGVAKNTYYKYKKEIIELEREVQNYDEQ